MVTFTEPAINKIKDELQSVLRDGEEPLLRLTMAIG